MLLTQFLSYNTRVDGRPARELLRVMMEEDNESALRIAASQLSQFGSSDAHQPMVAVPHNLLSTTIYVTQIMGR